MSSQPEKQFEFRFESPFAAGENPALWSPREIWVRLHERNMPYFGEDRRIDYKRAGRIDFSELARFLSMYSNTPDGGVIVFGADSRGHPTGCAQLSRETLNSIERCHIQMCPLARPEFKRIPVFVEGSEDFVLAIYIPYIGRLVETNREEAYIRYGDSRHLMSDEEKRDFRSTRQELSFELDDAPYSFPSEFDPRIVKDFCDGFRTREGRTDWSDQEILVDRHLGRLNEGRFRPNNALVLLAAIDPGKSIPGCRVRVQRFSAAEEGTGSSYNPIRDKFIEGNIVKIIGEAAYQIKDLNWDVTWLNKEGKFVTTPEYPEWAWFESLVNACVHRSYGYSGSEVTIKFFADRLEVESPGGFVPPVNENTIYVTRATRNYHLMDALRVLGYVRMAREGTRRIKESMSNWGLPDPVFRQQASHGVVVRVTLRNDYETRKRATDRDVASFYGVDLWKTLQEHEVKILAFAYHNPKMQVVDAQSVTGRRWQTCKKDLDKLVKRKILEFIPGDYARDPKAHYRLAEQDRNGDRDNRHGNSIR